MEDITDADYLHMKRVYKDFEIKNQENMMICKLKAIKYCQLMSLRDLEMFVSKYINLILQNFYSAPGLA